MKQAQIRVRKTLGRHIINSECKEYILVIIRELQLALDGIYSVIALKPI